MTLGAGTRLGPYEVVEKIGEGGMGEVYRARDSRLGRHVAVKILPAALAKDAAARDRFLREARTISALSHPNICPLFDIGNDADPMYLVMECVAGETLATTLRRGPLAVERALQIAAAIADGLAHAHAAGVIHRDLKPGNVMVLPDGAIKILDFGLARQLAGGADVTVMPMTESGVVSGTLAYMSPEQTLGKRVDARSDIFSLGVTLYEMLSGQRAFEGPSAFALMQNVVSHHPTPLERLRADVPIAVARYVERLMDKSPETRPNDAATVGAALRDLIAQGPAALPPAVEASAPTVASVRRMLSPPGRRLAWVLGAIVVVIAALGLVPAVRTAVRDRTAASSSQPMALPQTAADWTRLGRAYLQRYDQKGNIDRAIEAFGKAIALDASSAAAHAGLSESYRQKDSVTPDPQLLRQAVEAAERAVTLNPDLAASHAALGLAMLRSKQLEQGRSAIDRALDHDPTNLSALIGLAEYHTAKGDPAAAQAVLQRARQAAPGEWVPAQLLGRSLFGQAKYQDAATIWEEADRQTPDNVQILRNLGATYQMMERNDEAAAALQRALAIEPSATIYSNLGTLRFFQGRYSDAAAAFEKAVELNATFYLYWANLADAYRWIAGAADKSREAYARAIALVEERVRAVPDDPDMRTRLAMYAAKFGQPDRAAAELRQWKASGRTTPASHFRALVTHEILGQRDQALAALDAALKAGYAAREIHNEPELIKLRSDRRYHRIVAAFETAPAR